MLKLCLTSLGLGVGLAMDACAVSMTNGLNEPTMKKSKAFLIAFMFAFFQAFMPMIGWLCVIFIAEKFVKFSNWIPYIALVLLMIIGGKMLFDGVKDGKNDTDDTENDNLRFSKKLTFWTLSLQAVATSIDALSTGFSLADIAGNNVYLALLSVGIIAIVTFAICLPAIFIGKKFGNKLGHKAEILGGIILIAIGLEIFITGVFF